jgi:hypothetical protein
MVECPTCGDEFETDRAMKAHHQHHDKPYYDMVVRNEMDMEPGEFVQEYHRNQKLPLKEVGEKIGASLQTIKKMGERHGVETLSQSEAKEAMWERTDNSDKFLKEAHETTRELVDEGEHNFQDEDFERTLTDEFLEVLEGCGHALFRTNYNGYESWRSNHDYETEYVKVHRLLAVAECGVDEVAGKHVHHKNGVPWDNRPENIEVLDERDHLQEHYRDREIDANGRFK